ncbi:uncharacterized protein NEMAJ01_0870 [Nematocida major]|uniref:uncharacterized protein n=1 Tax=Nematocida major TaxID=1912982 RepID=UPI0020078A10|nr:uncharacterized protein NEMAJ01_0870 [Nematocida major]KAH9385974.1 hypothetical protein NEMAJ01_0870 [Nematocida major]
MCESGQIARHAITELPENSVCQDKLFKTANAPSFCARSKTSFGALCFCYAADLCLEGAFLAHLHRNCSRDRCLHLLPARTGRQPAGTSRLHARPSRPSSPGSLCPRHIHIAPSCLQLSVFDCLHLFLKAHLLRRLKFLTPENSQKRHETLPDLPTNAAALAILAGRRGISFSGSRGCAPTSLCFRFSTRHHAMSKRMLLFVLHFPLPTSKLNQDETWFIHHKQSSGSKKESMEK